MKVRDGLVLFLMVLYLTFAAADVIAATTEILSVTNDGQPGSTGDRHVWMPSGISNDGRYIAFVSTFRLTNDDFDSKQDIFIRDRLSGTTTLLTPPGFSGETPPFLSEIPTGACVISGDGNYIAFMARRLEGSININSLLLVNRSNGDIEIIKEGLKSNQYAIDYDGDIYYFDQTSSGSIYITKYDRQTKENIPLYSSNSITTSHRISVDDKGSLVCFSEGSPNVYLLEVATRNKILVSMATDGNPAGNWSTHSKISKSGDFVIFHSRATNLVSTPYPTQYQNLFLYDVRRTTVEKVNFEDPQFGYYYPSQHLYNQGIADISDDGRYIAALLTKDYSSYQYGAVLDRQTGMVEFLPDGIPTNNTLHPVISPDGRYVVTTGTTPLSPNGVFSLLYDRYGDANIFAVDAGPDQIVEQDSGYGGFTTLQGKLVKGACADGNFEWSWAEGATTGENPIVYLNAGTTLITLNWSGCGETATDTLSVAVRDTIAPTASVTLSGTLGQNSWYRSAITANLSATDSGSGVQDIRYHCDGGAEVTALGTSAFLSVSAEGGHTLDFYAVDSAGNVSTINNISFRIDTTAPLTAATLSGQTDKSGLFVTEVTVDLNATDAISGVEQIFYTINGAPWQSTSSTSATITVLENGSYKVVFYAIDAAGNVETLQNFVFSIDKTQLAPAIIENILDTVQTIPAGAIYENNPNYADKLTGELGKILSRMEAIGEILTPDEKIAEYVWAKKMLQSKVLDECNRMINDPGILNTIRINIAKAVSAIDEQIAQLNAIL